MAIGLYAGVQYYLVGDGVSTTITLDLTDQIAANPNAPSKAPDSLLHISTDGSIPVPVATLSGSKITMTWSAAIASGQQGAVYITLVFTPD